MKDNMKTSEMKIKFDLIDWCSPEVLECIPLRDRDPNDFKGESFKKKIIQENEDRKILRSFLEGLKLKYKQNWEVINNYKVRVNHLVENPFPELIEIPETKSLYVTIGNNIKNKKDIYYQILENNNVPNYQELILSISSDYRRKGSVPLLCNIHSNEDSYLAIFKSAIAVCNPHEIQQLFEYLSDEYMAIQKIDSKKESEEKYNEFCYSFHKSLRQTDAFNNGHAESIVWNLLQFTDIPHRAIKAVIEHVSSKEEIEQTK